MGFRIRKSIRIAPGVRLTFSKTGIGWSYGVPGYRITQQADGKVRRTASLSGTGLSYVTYDKSQGIHEATATATATAPVLEPKPEPKKPGLFASRGTKALYDAFESRNVASMEQAGRDHPDVALAAATVAGLFHLDANENPAALSALGWVFATGQDPSADPFLSEYVQVELTVNVAPGVSAHLGIERSAIGLLVAELHEATGDVASAIGVVEQLEPTTFAALSLAELYTRAGRNHDVVELTDGITNTDDTTALLCVFRGVALREEGFYDAARATFREALKSKARGAAVRHRAWWERARCYELEGKERQARADLQRILAEDSDYPGLQAALDATGL